MADSLELLGCEVYSVTYPDEALALVEPGRFDLALLELDTQTDDGIGALVELRRRDPDLIVLAVIGQGRLGSAAEAVRQGAYGCLRKPFGRQELQLAVEKALEHRRLAREVKALRARLALAGADGGLAPAGPGGEPDEGADDDPPLLPDGASLEPGLGDGSAAELSAEPGELSEELTLEELEKRYITRVLRQARNYDEAARILGIDPATLWRKRRRYGIA